MVQSSLQFRSVLIAAFAATWVGCGGSGSGGDAVSAPIVPAEEEFPGGSTTTALISQLSFSRPLSNLNLAEADGFFIGSSLFDAPWVTAPSSVISRDGLGPVFNARACSGCHPRDGRGAPPLTETEAALALLFRLGHPTPGPSGVSAPDSVYGDQLQPAAVQGVDGEGNVAVGHIPVTGSYADGTPFEIQRPVYDFVDLAYGPLDAETVLSPRVAPAVFGLGLLAAITEDDLLALEDPDDADGDGVSGRANLVPDVVNGGTSIGRFGWKAGQPSLRQQSTAAFAGDIGITSDEFPDDPVTDEQRGVIDVDRYDGGDPELDANAVGHVEFYMHTIAPPKRRAFRDAAIVEGRATFRAIGCAECHTPRFETGVLAAFPELSNQTIFPYTDLLLHDMGPDLADGIVEHGADGAEWRTPPLWGVGLIETVNGHQRLMHDGRARGVEEAILWHGGEGESAKQRFMELTAAERAALIAFVEDL
ncbi:MAG: di-heme oxidoredictase family protein [Planctomycetota bacterium]